MHVDVDQHLPRTRASFFALFSGRGGQGVKACTLQLHPEGILVAADGGTLVKGCTSVCMVCQGLYHQVGSALQNPASDDEVQILQCSVVEVTGMQWYVRSDCHVMCKNDCRYGGPWTCGLASINSVRC